MKIDMLLRLKQLAHDPQALRFLALVLGGGLVAAVAALVSWQYALVLAAGLAGLVLFAWQPTWGLYGIVLLYPFISLQVVFGSVNVPYVDVVAMLSFGGWLGRQLWLWLVNGQKMSWKQFPGLIFFLAFVAASFLSIINAEDKLLSLKYVLRPLSFFYLMFVIFPFNTLKTPKLLVRVFYIFYAVGVVAALDGLWGFLTYPASSILSKRAVPAAIFGLYPYGNSHNLIAEVLVAVIPIGLLLVWMNKQELTRKALFLGTLFMLGVNLLTFSRTGWIVVGVEFLVFGLVLYRGRLKQMARGLVIAGLVFAPVLIYMLVFSSQSFVQSSDENRNLLAKIAYQTWRDFPILGAGSGRFQEFVSKNSVYLIEFGAPSEAHGFIQKIGAEEGLLGLLTYLALLTYVLWVVFQAYRSSGQAQATEWRLVMLACLAMTLGTMVFELFQTSYFVSKMWLPLGLALAAGHLAKQHKPLPV